MDDTLNAEDSALLYDASKLDESAIDDYPDPEAVTKLMDKTEEDETQRMEANKEIEGTIDEVEMNKGYLRQQDYTKKTQALAEEKRRVQQREAELEMLFRNSQGNQTQTKPVEEDVLTQYDQEKIQETKRLLKAMGVLTRDEVEATRREEAERALASHRETIYSEFEKEFPEYAELDRNDPVMQRFVEQLKMYNTSDNNLHNLPKILRKAHADLHSELRSMKVGKKSIESKYSVDNSKSSISPGSSSKAAPAKKNLMGYSPSQYKVLEDFDLLD